MYLADPDLTPKILEMSETGETDEIYSVYLELGNTIDSVCDDGIIEWE